MIERFTRASKSRSPAQLSSYLAILQVAGPLHRFEARDFIESPVPEEPQLEKSWNRSAR